ncbi:uncharacterized protein N7529_009189 [Penicillium soppii]|uniref:uncharacterized protein n=1 Tax=Penicillium soppii TaxID=69789 RepID=UPI002546ED2E|nr:uncharacterized protein N7529_009189 [Penicillium soppii]KAJ5861879.1 hypothetical protein N7529_009189 [Penicillium soppii]
MAVPQRTLNWLYSVLTKDHYDPQQTYHDPNRAYHDVANALSQYPSLSPRTDVYTYETGFSALLLHLVGTLPVNFRGTTYRFPIALWIPNTYPREPPIAYVTPTQEMTVRVGQHVTLEGQVYHHYLAHWAEAWDRSTIADLLSILQDVFAKEPPVRYRQQMPQSQSRPEHAHALTPPPLPPLPPGVGSSQTQIPLQSTSQLPPPPPPKPGTSENRPQSTVADQHRSPQRPPLPPKEQGLRHASIPNSPLSAQNTHAPQYYAPLGHIGGPISSPLSQPPQSQSTSPQGQSYYRNGAAIPPQPQFPGQQQPSAQPQPAQNQSQQPLPNPPYPQHSPYPSNYSRPPPAQAPAPKTETPKTETPDLLTSPFEVELPSISGPAPPIPPNPEKDTLLRAVSHSLAESLRVNAAQSDIAVQSLVSQSRSLHSALATLQGEVSALNSLHATLQSNTAVLQQSIHRADATIADAPPDLPPIDDVLVAPTIVGKQLYDLVAEEQGIQQALYALQAALVKGIIGVDSWSKHTRSLAREALLKRALIRKIGRGMGLEEN